MKKKIIEKIRKLLALSTSPNENEAAIAIRKAQEMLRQYELTMADVLEVSEDNVRETMVPIKPSSRIPKWIQWMVSAITEILEVRAYGSWKLVNGKSIHCYYWVGFEVDVALAHHAFLLLQRGIQDGMRARRKELRSRGYSPPRNFRNSYAMGFLLTVKEKLRVLARQSQQEEIPVPDATDLPVMKQKAIDRYMENLDLEGPRKERYLLNRNSFQLGVMDGQEFRVNRPVEGTDGIVRTLA